MNQEHETFIWHLGQLRKHLLRVFVVMLSIFVIAFIFGKPLFKFLVLSPMHTDFYFYQLMCWAGQIAGFEGFCGLTNSMQLINVEIAGQFMAQVKTAFLITLLLSLPYFMLELWLFVAPALYEHEKKVFSMITILSSLLFYVGAMFGWFVLVPLSVLFLGNYQLDDQVHNMIHIDSYMSFFFIIVIGSGLMFLVPLIVYGVVRIGLLQVIDIRRYRRYIILAIFIIMAILSPTTDALSLLVMSLPLIFLFEGTMLFLKRYEKNKQQI